MDLTSKCACSHHAWEHDIGGDARGCRYCSCELAPGKAAYPLPPRAPNDFLPKPDWLRSSPLFGSGLGYAGTFGAGRLSVYIMAESLGVEEERQGRPLVGPSGKLAARMVYRTTDPETNLPLSLDDDFWRGNIVPVKPPFDKLDAIPYPIRADLLGRCRPIWEADLAARRPRAILALGAHALRALTGRGEITRVRGAIIQTPYGPVIPTYHPAYLLRGKTHLAQVWQIDLRRALYVARHGVPSNKVYYTLYPTGDDTRRFYEEWVEKGRPPIAFDIETPHSSAGKDEDQVVVDGDDADLPVSEDPSYKIDRISMSFAGKTALTAPWVEPHISWFKRILLEADVSWGWNSSSFDVPRLTANGAPLGPRSNHVDLMLLWHLLEPSLPMGLKPTSTMFFFDASADWAGKTLANSDPPLYSAMDSDFTARLGEMLTARAQREGKWEMFLRHYVLLDRILRRMTAKGVRTDRGVRLAARARFLERLSSTVASLQPHIPLDIRPRKVYKKPEEALRKGGQWVEGEMVEVEVMEALPKRWVYFYRINDGKPQIFDRLKAASEEDARAAHWLKPDKTCFCGAVDAVPCAVSFGKRPKAPPKPKKKTFIVTYRKALKKGEVVKTRSIKALTVEDAMGKVDGAISAEEAV